LNSFFKSLAERLRIALVPKPDPTKPLVAAWYLAKPGEHGERLFVFLPGRGDRVWDFVRRGFVALAQSCVSSLDCVAVDATIGYYLDGSVAGRLQREIIEPARRRGYREIWLVGVSMGGLGAFFHERKYPGEVTGMILLAPFVGDDPKLFAEIDAAGGPTPWACSQPAVPAQPNKAKFQRELWLFLGRLKIDTDPQLQIWVAYGDADRLRAGIERLISLIPPRCVSRLKGGHTWEVWTKGFAEILAKIVWGQNQPEFKEND
jgi:pimeloyl-ACP methyl ester carboxylesterase